MCTNGVLIFSAESKKTDFMSFSYGINELVAANASAMI